MTDPDPPNRECDDESDTADDEVWFSGQTDQPPMSRPGAKLNDNDPDTPPMIEGYEIYAKLGQGGMGTVWKADQRSTKRLVALKLMRSGVPWSDRAKARFAREVELAARLDHPCIARVYDSGLDKGVYYYAMQFVDGVHLDDPTVRALPRRKLLELIRTICQAVQHAHQRGVIHRDLKPSNVKVTADGSPCVLDFGLAKTVIEDTDAQVTVSEVGELAGTLRYMSPEQASGDTQQVDTRSDVYSLGVILFFLLLQEYPHDMTGTSFGIQRRIVDEEVRRPRTLDRSIDRELEAILLKALAKDPDQRYASAGNFAQDLDRYLGGDPVTAQRSTMAYVLRKWVSKNCVPVAVAVLVIATILGLIAFGFIRERNLRQRAQHEANVNRRLLYFNNIVRAQEQAQSNTSRAAELLNDCPEDLRHAEWHVVNWLVDQSIHTIQPSGPANGDLAWNRDSQEFVSANRRSTRTLDPLSGRIAESPHRSDGHDKPPSSVAISPNGRYVTTLEQQSRVKDSSEPSLAKEPQPTDQDRSRFTVAVRDLITSETIRADLPNRISPRSIAVGPEGANIALNSGSSVHVWDLREKRVREVALPKKGRVSSLRFSPDGHSLMISGQVPQPRTASGNTTPPTTLRPHRSGFVLVWDLSLGSTQWSRSYPSVVHSVAYRDDNQVTASASGGYLDLTDSGTGRSRIRWKANGRALAFNPDDDTLAAAEPDGTIQLWDLQSQTPLETLRGHTTRIRDLVFSSDGRYLLSQDTGGVLKVWATRSGLPPQAPSWDDELIAVSPDGRYLVLAEVGTGLTRLVDSRSRRENFGFGVTCDDLSAVRFSSDGSVALTLSGTAQKTLELRHTATGAVTARYPQAVTDAQLSHDGTQVVLCRGREVIWWDTTTNQTTTMPAQHEGLIRAVALGNTNPVVASGGDDATICVTGQWFHKLIGHDSSVVSVQFMATGSERLVSIDLRDTVKLWDTVNGVEIATLSEGKRVPCLAMPGPWIVIGGHREIRCIDARDGQTLNTLTGHTGFVRALAVSDDGARLASGGEDGTIKLWDLENGLEIITLEAHRAAVSFLTFTPDGRGLLSVDRHGRSIRWGRIPP